jgi:hypothetical protein
MVKLPNKNILFSHAGVTKFWLELHNIEVNDNIQDNINNLINTEDGIRKLATIGHYRTFFGEKTGSPLWCDLREFVADEQIPSVYQIFGHTRLKAGQYYSTDNFACIDCQKCFIVNDEGNLSMID